MAGTLPALLKRKNQMPFYTEPKKVDYEKLWAALDADFDKKIDSVPECDFHNASDGDFHNAKPNAIFEQPSDTRRTINGFAEPPAEPRTRAGFGLDFLALKSPLPTFSTDAAWKQKVEIVRKLNKTELGKHILKNPFLSYIFLRATDNINAQNILKKHPLWIKIFQ